MSRFEELRAEYTQPDAVKELLRQVPLADYLLDALEELDKDKGKPTLRNSSAKR